MNIMIVIALIVILVIEAYLVYELGYEVHRMRMNETEMRSLGFVVEGHDKRLQELERRAHFSEKKRSEAE